MAYTRGSIQLGMVHRPLRRSLAGPVLWLGLPLLTLLPLLLE